MFKKVKKVLIALVIILLIIALSVFVLRMLFPAKYTDEIYSSCKKFGVDDNLVLALIKAESDFNPNAVSKANAKGIMQLTDDTFDYCNSNLGTENADILNPEDNIRAGVWYLSHLLDRYNGNVENALAAYNAGPLTVDRWLNDTRYSSDGKVLSDIPYGETSRHIEKTLRYRTVYRILYR